MSLHTASFGNALFLAFPHPHAVTALRTVIAAVRPGPVHVLGVLTPATRFQKMFTPRDTAEHVESTLHHALEDDLADLVRAATGERTPSQVTWGVASGHVVSATLQTITDGDHDLLAVTGHPDDPRTRAVITRLQRKSPVPVWTLRPTRARKRRILAAIDVDEEHRALDHRILAAASWLARPGDELHLLTAWELLGESTLRSSPFLSTPDDEIDRLRTDVERQIRSELDALIREHGLAGSDLHVHVRNGPAPESIGDQVERSSIDQLVIGTIARHGIPGFVMGNTAEQVLSRVPCSEFVVKPPER